MTDRRQLDRTRLYGKVYGIADHAFEQDGRCFDARGYEVPPAASAPLRPPQVPPVDIGQRSAPGTGGEDRRHPPIRRPASETSAAAAERMRRTRHRRRRGVVAVIAVEITQADIDRFVARNLLPHADIGDRQALSGAVRRALGEWAKHRTP